MKKKHMAILLAAAMTLTSADATAAVSAADFTADAESSEVTDDQLEEAGTASDDTQDAADSEESEPDVEEEEPEVTEEVEDITSEDMEMEEDSADTQAEDLDQEAEDDPFTDGEAAEAESSESGVIPIELNKSKSLKIDHDKEYVFSFTPKKSGRYIFCATNATGASVEDKKDGKRVGDWRVDISGLFPKYDKGATATLKAGHTYYLNPSYEYENTTSTTVTVKQIPKITSVTLESSKIDKNFYVLEAISPTALGVNVTYSDGSKEHYVAKYYGLIDSYGYDLNLMTRNIKNGKSCQVNADSKLGVGKYQVYVDKYMKPEKGYTITVSDIPINQKTQLKLGYNKNRSLYSKRQSMTGEIDQYSGYYYFKPTVTETYTLSFSKNVDAWFVQVFEKTSKGYISVDNSNIQPMQGNKLSCKLKAGKIYIFACDRIAGKNTTFNCKITSAGSKVTLAIPSSKTITLKEKGTYTVKTSGIPKGDKIVSWKSSNTAVADVSKKGVITGKKAGTAQITVKLLGGGSSSFNVNVKKAASVKTTDLKVVNKANGKTMPSKTVLARSKKLTLSAKVTPTNSTEKVTYTSSNKAVATVSAGGTVTAKKKGTAVITVKSGQKSVKIRFTVK